jgi:hypothetical protein
MPTRDQEEQDWKISVMQTDLRLKDKQAFWETPRNIALLVTAVAAIAGVLGFKIGQNNPPVTQIIFQPGSIVVPPAR